MAASMMALAAAGVEGVAVEAWWGIVEGDKPGEYNWGGYLDLVGLARRFGLKVRVILAFHQCGAGPGDLCWFVIAFPPSYWITIFIRHALIHFASCLSAGL